MRVRNAIAVAAAFALASCGGSPQGPTPQPPPAQQAPTVTAVSPKTGAASGGAAIIISGTNFAAGATVTIGGAAATGVTVQNPTTLVATTPSHAAGTSDVVVSVNGLSGTLPGGFTFETPPAANAPPLITDMVAQGRRRGAPRNFADLEDLVDVQVTVQDAETPPDQLTYRWDAAVGSFEGEGPAVRWRAPDHATTPANVLLRVTVIEKYEAVNSQGQRTPAEHQITGSVAVNLHDSEKEIIDLGRLFLVEFSQQQPGPEAIVRNFTDSCRGKFDELDQVRDNQRRYRIQEWSVGDRPEVVVAFGAVCPYYAPERLVVGDGCAWFPVRWKSLDLDKGGAVTDTRGFDQVNAVLENGQWRLCDSDYKATTTTADGVPTSLRFKK